MDMAVDSKIMIFSPTKKGLQAWRHPGANPSHNSESVCTEPTADTNDSLDCTNKDDVILFLFPELFAFVCYLESELDTSMDEVFRLTSDYCPLVEATAPTDRNYTAMRTQAPSIVKGVLLSAGRAISSPPRSLVNSGIGYLTRCSKPLG
jgi:hypothetical protein